MLDTSGYGSGVCRELFAACADLELPAEFDDGTGPANPVFDHWFLLDGGMPVRHIEVNRR
jgi:hypothetical protein